MSSIDNRIVQMEFDNAQFESGVKSTVSLLDKLKAALKFGSEGKESFEEVQNASKNFSLDGMASAIDNINSKFTLMGQIGYQVMQRIASSAVNTGISLAKSLSIDQISAGMTKYEEETNAVQTMYYALKDQGTTLEDVYSTLDKVAAYADQTSYSYTQMTNAMSQFTTAGVDIKDAEIAVEGIANAAAKAGIGISSTAILFRNFADAISAGKMRLQDYKSLQLGKFDTREFRKQVIEAAKAVGTLNEEGYIIDETTGKVNKKYQVTVDNFTSMLQHDFMTTAVMTKVLSKYADTTEEFGLEAYHAAQQAKTFTDVMDSLKDVIGTGWKTSFRYIFGDLNEAIDFFSWLADAVIDATSVISTFRNQILSDWKDAGGRDLLIGGIKAWFEDFVQIGDHALRGLITGMNLSNGWSMLDNGEGYEWIKGRYDWLVNLSQAFKDAGEAFKNWLEESSESWTVDSVQTNLSNIGRIMVGIGSVADTVGQFFGGIRRFAADIMYQLGPSLSALLQWLGSIGTKLRAISKILERKKFFSTLGKKFAKIFDPITNRLPKLIKQFEKWTDSFWLFIQNDEKIQSLVSSFKKIFGTILDYAPKAVDALISWGEQAFKTVRNSDEWKWIKDNFNKYIAPIWDEFVDFADVFGADVNKFFTMNTTEGLTWWESLQERFTAFDGTREWLANKWENLKEDYEILQTIEGWWNSSEFIANVKEWLSTFSEAFDAFMNEDTSDITSLVGKLKKRFDAFFSELMPFLDDKWNTLKSDYRWLQGLEDWYFAIKSAVDAFSNAEIDPDKGWFANLKIRISAFFDDLIPFIEGLFENLKRDHPWIRTISDFFESIFGGSSDLESAAASANSASDAVEESSGLFGALGKVFDSVKALISKFTFSDILTAIGLIKVIKDLYRLFTGTSYILEFGKTIVEAVKNVGGAIEQAYKYIKAQKMASQTKALLNVAFSIGILAYALKTISELSWDEIGRGLTGMAGLFAEEGAFMAIMGFFSSDAAAVRGMKLNVNSVSSMKMIGIATAITILANTLIGISSLGWDKASEGLDIMRNLFVEEGFFMVVMGVVSKYGINVNSVNPLNMAGLATSINILGNGLIKLSELGWDKAGPALGEMALLFTETGAFSVIMAFFSKKYELDPSGISAVTGLLSWGMGELAKSVAQMAQYSFVDILKGLGGLLGIMGLLIGFVATMGALNISKLDIGFNLAWGATIVMLAGAIWILAQALIPLSQMDFLTQMIPAIAGMMLVMLALYAFSAATIGLHLNVGGAIQALAAGIVLAGVMVAFALAAKIVSDVDPWVLIAFAVAIDLVTLALGGAMVLVTTLQGIPVTALMSSTVKMALLSVALGAAVALLGGFAGLAASNISDDIAHVGSELALFSEVIAGIDTVAIDAALDCLEKVSASMLKISVKSLGMGNLDTFRKEMTRLASSLVIFDTLTGKVDSSVLSDQIDSIVEMATKLSGVPEIGDVGTSIAKIGGAVKIYNESFEGVETDNLPSPPDGEALTGIFEALNNAVPDQGLLDSFSEYADQGKADALTDFAIGIENVGTAVSAYSKACAGLEFGDMNEANKILIALAGLQTTEVASTSVTAGLGLFGSFALEVKSQKESLSDFADDVVVLGGALESYSTSCGIVDIDKMDSATDVVRKIADINDALPPTGGLSTVLTGEKSLTHFAGNIKLLGKGAADFFNSIKDTTIDTAKVGSAVDALVKIGDIQAKLPQLGGIGSWFVGDENLGTLGSSLGELGTGLNKFVTNYGSKAVGEGLTDAVKMLDSLADIQIKISNNPSWYNMGEFAEEIKNMASYLTEANTILTGITWYTGNVDKIEKSSLGQLLTLASDIQVKLGDTTYTMKLKDFGIQLKDMFNQINKINISQSKIDQVSGYIQQIMGSFSESFETGGISSSITDTIESVIGVVNGNAGSLEASLSPVGKALASGISAGIISQRVSIGNAVASVLSSVKNTANVSSQFVQIGRYLMAGLATGIRSNASTAVNAAREVSRRVLNASKVVLSVESPSREFYRIGMYIDQGLANGIMAYSNVAENAASDMAQSSITSVLNDLYSLSKMDLSQMDVTPTIRPVIDMSGLEEKSGFINSMITGRMTARVTGIDTRKAEIAAQKLAGSQDASIEYLAKISAQLDSARADMNAMKQDITNMQIVLDTGEFVGATAPKMDQALGTVARRGRRI